jgi:outer membrane biosynthesis protein TonB
MKDFASPCRLAVLLSLTLLALPAPSRAFGQESAPIARKVVLRVAPKYPELAKESGVQGNVKAEVLVAPSGAAKQIAFKGGHPLLIQAAQKALQGWRWEPAAHESHEMIELRFTP